ncbi:MAG: flagellar basal body-associated FliL family protein [Verrucomicrobia bacterium]|nr:flagellar basal body-associated FliL family protein [Verrucomicrobiota bacterium]
MAENRLEGAEATKTEAAGAAPAAGAAKAGSGWVPLIVAAVVMPGIAWALTTYVLAPKLQQAVGHPATSQSDGKASEGEAAGGESSAKGGKSAKTQVPLTKVLVNVAGTGGTRYLLVNMTLVGGASDFKSRIEEHKEQLVDAAGAALAAKTIADLEKPGARNLIRAELMTVLNNVIGQGQVKEIYFTEFAVQ